LADARATVGAEDRLMRTRLGAVLITLMATAVLAPAAQAKKPLGNKWRVTNVLIGGNHTAVYDDGDKALELEAETFYEGRGKGKPFTLRLSDRRPKVIIAPVNYTGDATAKLSFRDGGTYDCSFKVDEEKRNLVGLVWVSPNGVKVQWTLTPMGYKCPGFDPTDPALPEFNTLSEKSMTTKFPVRRFTKKTATVPVRIKWTDNKYGWKRDVVWTGKVTFSR
jgi:hypothetical protein